MSQECKDCGRGMLDEPTVTCLWVPHWLAWGKVEARPPAVLEPGTPEYDLRVKEAVASLRLLAEAVGKKLGDDIRLVLLDLAWTECLHQVEAERRARCEHALEHVRKIECERDHDELGLPCPVRVAREAMDGCGCSMCGPEDLVGGRRNADIGSGNDEGDGKMGRKEM